MTSKEEHSETPPPTNENEDIKTENVIDHNSNNEIVDPNDQHHNQEPIEAIPLDWTNINKETTAPPACRIVFPWEILDETPYSNNDDEDADELRIIGTTGKKITKMGTDLSKYFSPNLKTLIFRCHIIRKMEGLSKFTQLETLELYDNIVHSLDGLNDNNNDTTDAAAAAVPGSTLKVLDMSYNVIRDMEPVQFCPNLVELYLAQNKLKELSGLKHLSNLRKLDLGANRIRVMDTNELSGLINLEDLWLGKNKIEKIQGLEKLTKLRRLDVQSNRLTCIENLSSQTSTLEEIYLADNGITDIGASQPETNGLCGQTFPNLTIIDLSKNQLTMTDFLTTSNNVMYFPSLEDLWISGNKISQFDKIQNLSFYGKQLQVIYLEFNPIDKEFDYRIRLKELIPSLDQIDATRIEFSGDVGARGSGAIISLQERMKELQNLALEKAKESSS